MILATALAVAPPSAEPAEAYTFYGCKLPSSSIAPLVKYGSVTATIKNATNNAISRWNAVAVPVNFAVTTGTTHHVWVYEASFPQKDWWAETTKPGVRNGVCSGPVTITWNTPLQGGPYTDVQKRMIATHELGHALGLGHMPVTQCTQTKTVMAQTALKWSCGWGSEPWADDINGINYLY